MSGDITPTYVELTPDDISQIAKALPDVKIILLVRDPVARAASRLSMAYRNGDFDAGLLENLDVFRKFVETSIILSEERSRPSQIVARWAESAPSVQSPYFSTISRTSPKRRGEKSCCTSVPIPTSAVN